ncbi:MAG: HAD-IB family phosphatase [Thermoplasmata archaeon]|nr:HAD-IB family phosphatase [Thermoplasmata archaeon]
MLRLVAFDMDGTLVDVDSSWGAVHRHFGDENAEALDLFVNDRIDDEEFVRRDIRKWWTHRPGLTVQDLGAILDAVPLMPGARALFDELHRRRVGTAIISGGIDVLAKRIGRELGIEYVLANGFRVDASGRLTGEGIIRVPIKGKERVLEQVQRQLGVSVEETASVGNSDIDVGLFRRSRIGVAFQPADEHVRSQATASVTERDMTLILPHLFPE